MKVSQIFKFLDSVAGEHVWDGTWGGEVAGWHVSVKLPHGIPEVAAVELKNTFEFSNSNNGKQTFAEKLREAATSLISMADEAEAALRETA